METRADEQVARARVGPGRAREDGFRSAGERAASLPVRLGVLVDGAMVVAAAAAAHLSASLAGIEPPSAAVLVALPLLTLALLAKGGLYRQRLRLELLDDVVVVAAATTVAAAFVISAAVLATGDAAAGEDVVRQWLFTVAYLAAGRAGLSIALARARRADGASVPVLVVGAGEVGQLVARRLRERPELGLRPVAFLDSGRNGSADGGLPVLRDWDAASLLSAHRVGQVLIADSHASEGLLLELVRGCNRMGVPVALVPRLFEAVPADVEVEHLGGVPLVSVRPSDPRSWRFTLKYAFDRIAAAAALVLLAPLLLGAAVAVRVSLGRPILFRQVGGLLHVSPS